MREELELPIEEIERRCADRWVLVEETTWDAQGNPTRGRIAASAHKREKLVLPTRRLHAQKPGIKTFVFYAGPKVPEDVSVIL